MKGLTVTPYHEAKEVTRFELSLGFTEHDGQLSGALEYDENMFTAETTSRMCADYVQLLTVMLANPNAEISSFSLTSNDEIEQLSSSFVESLEV
jgi:non-ribosomal peptide synthetase component F